MRRLAPLLVLLLTAPLALAATGGRALDQLGDQTTFVATGSSLAPAGAPAGCRDPATDVAAFGVAVADGVVTLRVEVADLASPGLSCGGTPLASTQRHLFELRTPGGMDALASATGGRASVLLCGLFVDAWTCMSAGATSARDGNAVEWRFPLAQTDEACGGCGGWDLAGARFEARARAGTVADAEPGRPTVGVADGTGVLFGTL